MTIQIDGTTTVRELVGHYPQTRPVLEQHGIDYCCGGGQALADVARQRGLELSALASELQQALACPPSPSAAVDRDWYAASLAELVQHIVSVHHAYLKQALPRLRTLLATVLSAHSARHGDMLGQVRTLYDALHAELSSHMLKEEQVLFPYVVAMEECARDGAPMPPAMFGTVRNPVRQMEHEHEEAGSVLSRLRAVTGNYQLPEDACATFAALYQELQQMEADLHQHIHLENNILFPRVIELER